MPASKSTKSASEKPPKPPAEPLDNCPWTDAIVWKLIALLEEPENYKVLFGKKDPKENTSGESKASVYRRIAQAVFPDMYAKNGKLMGDRIKAKVDKLTKIYQEHAKRLRTTGEGVGAENDDDSQETLNFYIMGEGPCVETPAHARNIWGSASTPS